MPAYITGTTGASPHVHNLMLAIDTQVTANGWTVYDSISVGVGTRDIVYRSTALDATALNYSYVRIYQSGQGIGMRIYMDWDPVTHVGMNTGGTGSASVWADVALTYWMRVNPYAIALCVLYSANYYQHYSGFLRRTYPASRAGLTRTTSAYAIGTSTFNVASSMVGKLEVGQKVLIYNNAHNSASANASNAEALTILSIAAGSITFSSPSTKAYDIGAVIGANPINTVVTQNSWLVANSPYYPWYCCLALDGTWTSATGQPTQFNSPWPTVESSNDPGDIYQEYLPSLFGGYDTTTNKQGFRGYLYHWYPVTLGVQTYQDIMDDGDNTFIVLGLNSTTSAIMLGPRE